MSWCCNPCGRDDADEDTQPLLSDYDDDTSRQRELHKKLHTYQMLRALRQGYLPSTEQAIIQLRVLLASDILNPDEEVRNSLSPSGQLAVKLARQWLAQFIELLRDKNTGDSVQDFLYFLPKGRVELDAQDMLNSASHLATLKPRLDASAAYESAKIIGTLLFGNRDFRLFLTDLNIIAREVFADTASSVANVAEQVAERIAPTELESEAVKQPGAEGVIPITSETVAAEAAEIGVIVQEGITQTAVDAGASISEHLSGVEKETLLVRLQQVVSRLRQRKDYTTSVSTIQFLLQRYVEMYSRTIAETVDTVSDDVHTNPELDRALEKLWKVIGSFGDRRTWDGLAVAFNKVIVHIRRDPDLEVLMRELGVALNRLFTDPEFFNNTDRQINSIREKFDRVGNESSLRGDLDDLIAQAKVTYEAIFADSDVTKLRQTSWRLFNLLSPLNQTINEGLVQDAIHVFLPVLISAIQYIPIPRFELSAPDLDLLVESLVLEPGRTVNHSSFFPFRLRVETHNEVSITKARFRTHSQVGTTVSVHAEGISIRADELGFWLRLHSGLFRFADEGIASFALDERGIDLTLELDIAADDVDKIISLRSASVKIHHFDYTLRQSKLSWLAWLAKPILRPILRGILEKSIASAVENALHAANRELVYARERLRATRVADPDDLATFFRAVFARFSPPEADGDTYAALGVSGSAKAGPNDGKPNVFRGVYAPGSIVKVWEEEATKAPEIVEDEARGRWRNAIFDVPTMAMH